MIGRSAYFLKQELETRGYAVTEFDDPYLLFVQKGTYEFYTNAAKGPLLSATSYMMCRNKYLTRQVLENFHLQNPRYAKITKDKMEKVQDFHFPVVVKPLFLEGGEGVEINVSSIKEVADYFMKYPHYPEVLLEEMLEGED